MKTLKTVSLGIVVLASAAFLFVPPAGAGEWILTPHAGVVFGGDLSRRGIAGNVSERHGTYGAGFGYLSNGVFGFEVDFGYSPHFFGGGDLVPDNNLTSLMGNFVLAATLGDNSRLYLSGGGGLLKSRVNDTNDFFDVSRNDFGANAGVGFIAALGQHYGLRGDVRYFRNVGDPVSDSHFQLDLGSFDFWQAWGGLTFRF